MNSYDREQIERIPKKYRPLTAWQIFGWSIIFGLPVVGQILLIVFCFFDGCIPRRSFARSYFCGLILLLIVLAIGFGCNVFSEIVYK